MESNIKNGFKGLKVQAYKSLSERYEKYEIAIFYVVDSFLSPTINCESCYTELLCVDEDGNVCKIRPTSIVKIL